MDVRLFRPDDLEETLELLRVALGETPLLARSEQLFSWKHFDNPFGGSIILVAVIDGRLAGIRAIMRWELTDTSGATIRAGRMVDTATHPDFQRRGIFRQLTNEAVELARAEGIDLLFNTPNSKSRPGYLKMGWQPVGPVRVAMRPALGMARADDNRIDALADIAAFFPDGGVSGPLPNVTDRSTLGLRTPRHPEYLHWRYRSHPTARYAVITKRSSAAICRVNHRRGRRELVISDLIGPQPYGAARRALGQAKYDYAVGSFRRGSPERRAAIASGLVPVPRLSALQLVARPLTDLDVSVTTMRRWDLTLGDLELL